MARSVVPNDNGVPARTNPRGRPHASRPTPRASPTTLAADLEDATNALISLDAHAALALGKDNAALGPMSAILLRTESATSSQIENLTAGTTAGSGGTRRIAGARTRR